MHVRLASYHRMLRVLRNTRIRCAARIVMILFGALSFCAQATITYNESVEVIPQSPRSGDEVQVKYRLIADNPAVFKSVAQQLVGTDLQVVIELDTAGPGIPENVNEVATFGHLGPGPYTANLYTRFVGTRDDEANITSFGPPVLKAQVGFYVLAEPTHDSPVPTLSALAITALMTLVYAIGLIRLKGRRKG